MTVALTPNARVIFEKRYSRKDEDGNPTETPEEAVQRVARNVASVNALYAYDPDSKWVATGAGLDVGEFPFRTAIRSYEWLRQRGDISEVTKFPEVVLGGWTAAEEKAKAYEEMISRLDFLPNSPTWTGAGTPLGQLAACFVLPVDDDLVTGPDSIYSTLKNAIAIQQTGGGNGFSFGRLRPRDALVKRSMGKASGPMGFASSYNASFKEMAQGGTRRGANMLVLPVHHPDIRQFIGSKTVEGELDQFNFSVAITDEFMVAVEKDEDFDLRHDGKVYETIRARDLWDEITQSAWIIGDPGLLFIDKANAENPVPLRYTLEATNPCGEQWLGPYENCCLGSISLKGFANWDGSFDWEGFRQTVVTATEFLDDVVDANQYVEVVPQLEGAAMGGRRIGLGLMGLADALVKMGLRYGEKDALDFASQVTEFARYHAMLTSIERARERGPFEWIEGSIYDPRLHAKYGAGAVVDYDAESDSVIGIKLWEPPTPLVEHVRGFGRPVIDWTLVNHLIAMYGIRNSCQFTFAPTGTISNVAGLEGSGCEPFFALAFIRKVMQEGENIELAYASALFEEALHRTGMGAERIATIAKRVQENGGSCQGVPGVPESVQRVFVVAADVTPSEHIWTQAVLQRFVDNSISKTINMPYEATVEDVANAYKLAYELGCKGITIYRQGSRSLEVLSTTPKPVGESGPEMMKVSAEGEFTIVGGSGGTGSGVVVYPTIASQDWPVIKPMKIPAYAKERGLAGRVFPVDTAFGKVQVTVTELDEHPERPFDIRLQLGKAGNDKNADVEALGRVISVALRAGVAVEAIVEQLEGIGGQTIFGFGERKVRSVADGIAKLLARRYLGREEQPKVAVQVTESVTVVPVQPPTAPLGYDPTQICPECHGAFIVVNQGCSDCKFELGGCGWSKCG